MNNQPLTQAPGAEWRAILSRESLEKFACAFVKTPLLVASVANAPVHGAADIRRFFATSAAIYEHIAFTSEAILSHTTLLGWQGLAFGQQAIAGRTLLIRGDAGLIERIELYHRPLSMVLAFAHELERRLGETLGAHLFAPRLSV
jgi:hypothetical protein